MDNALELLRNELGSAQRRAKRYENDASNALRSRDESRAQWEAQAAYASELQAAIDALSKPRLAAETNASEIGQPRAAS